MNRRHFIKGVSALGAAPFVTPFSMSCADAADTGGYKALVCLFLFGGNDSHNLIVPLNGTDYSAYAAARGGLAEANGLALPQSTLLPITPAGWTANSFGLHPALPKLKARFDAQKLAIVANSGPMVEPTSLAQYNARSVALPPQLFSHSDMQAHWQTMQPDQPADDGWAGRLADVFQSAALGALPVSLTLGGGNLLLKGNQVTPYAVLPMPYLANSNTIDSSRKIANKPLADISWNWTNGVLPQVTFTNAANASRANLLEQQYNNVIKSSLDISDFVTNAMYTGTSSYALKVPVPGVWPVGNGLAAQLHTVAAMIAARQALNVSRQIFFVALGGFDTHGDQFGSTTVSGTTYKSLLNGKHFGLLQTMDNALDAFYASMALLGLENNVTTMTMSDFGRTLRSNGAGSDHGWGGHQLVLGGAVNGGRIIGDFPMPSSTLAQVDVGQGRLLPTTAADSYCAAITSWFGASPAEQSAVFPNLNRFAPLSTPLFV